MDSDHSNGTGSPRAPLHGVRIIDTTKVLAGPYATMILSDLGAEVIKIERPPQGDTSRFVNSPRLGYDSAYFMQINHGKKSVVLDLKTPAGRELVYRMVEKADVFFENNQPETSVRLGVDYETLRQRNPKIIVCSMSGFGQFGPSRDEVGLDLTIQARSGQMSVTGTGKPGEPPLRQGVPLGDVGAGLWASQAVAAALYRRSITGEGAHLDISLLDCAVAFTSYMAANYFASGEDPRPVGNGHHSAAPYGAFPTTDGWVVIAVYASMEFWERFCHGLGRSDLFEVEHYKTNLQRAQHQDELDAEIGRVTSTNTTEHWCQRFLEVGIPASPVQKLSGVFSDPQVVARDMIATMDHPEHGAVRVVGNPVRFDDWHSGATVLPAPRLGEHTEEVLSEVVGLDPGEIKRLIEDEVVRPLSARDTVPITPA